MTQVSTGGLVVAQHIAAAYCDNPNVQAVIVGGSVARGSADHYSDLELGVFWSQPPSDEERKQAIARVGGELWSLATYQTDPEGVVNDQYGLNVVSSTTRTYQGSLMVSMNHVTSRALEYVFTDVQEHYDTALEKHVLIAAVQDAYPLYGHTLVQAWQARASVYPDRLAIKVIQENLWCGPWCVPQAYAERNDWLVLYQHFVWMQQSILKILAGLNRIYYRSVEYKWTDALIARFALVPPALSVRMKQAFQHDLQSGVQIMREVIEETVDLVEQYLPDVNRIPMFAAHPEITTAWARQRWKAAAPYTLLEAVGAATNMIDGAG